MRRSRGSGRMACPRLFSSLAGQRCAEGDVFTGPNGRPLLRRELSAAWRAAKRATDVPVGLRLYDLRHHWCTLTARKPGVTTKELMARIGHSSWKAALAYQHAAGERDREVADFMDDA